jgi:PAS domain S-box-containing protein
METALQNQESLTTFAELQHQLRQTQAALAASQAKFDLIFQQSLDAIVVIDGLTGHILDANQTTQKVLGYPPEILIGQHFSIFLPSIDHLPPINTLLDQFRIHGVALEGHEFRRADGSWCPIDLTVNLVPWHQETAIVATLRDVTERRRAEEAQLKLIQELDAFAHTVAHDLKSPLGILVGASAVLQDLPALQDDDCQMLTDLISENSNRMSNIIEELLLLAQMRNLEIELYPLDMGHIVRESNKRLGPLLKEYQAEVIIAPTWPLALGYGPWIEEVWVNYLSNALKYGGQPPQIEFGADASQNGQVRFWIRDNGSGLTPAEQGRLFTQFTQLAKVRAEGHGLGLSIVRRIVEKLGGEVGVQSEIGVGSVFSFTLRAVD